MNDYTALNIDFNALGPELTLFAASFLILCFIALKRMKEIAPVISLAAFCVAFYLTVGQWWDDPVSGFAGMLTCDNYGVMFKGLFLLCAILTMLMSEKYLALKKLDNPEFYALLMVSTAGMMVMANTNDLVVMLVGLEIMSVPLYVMAALNRKDLRSNEAGAKYFFMGAFATSFLLMGIAFVFGAAETTNLRSILADFSYIAQSNGAYLYPGLALIMIGFGFKIGMVPFHTWIPDVYQGTPTPLTGFFSVAPKAAGFAVMMRIFLYGFSDAEGLTELFWVLAVLTMTVGNIMAIRQSNVKRMLAYSSIAHAGYILVGLSVGTELAVSAAVFYLVGYALFNLGAFAILTHLETREGTESEFTEFHGLAGAHPYLAALMALFILALAGFPPTIGFFGKFYLFSAAIKEGFIWLAVIGVLNSFISVYYYLQVIKASYFVKADTGFVSPQLRLGMMVTLIIAAIGTLGLGLFPSELLDLSRSALFAFL